MHSKITLMPHHLHLLEKSQLDLERIINIWNFLCNSGRKLKILFKTFHFYNFYAIATSNYIFYFTLILLIAAALFPLLLACFLIRVSFCFSKYYSPLKNHFPFLRFNHITFFLLRFLSCWNLVDHPHLFFSQTFHK